MGIIVVIIRALAYVLRGTHVEIKGEEDYVLLAISPRKETKMTKMMSKWS